MATDLLVDALLLLGGAVAAVALLQRHEGRHEEPAPDTTTVSGNVLVVFGTPEAVEHAEKRLRGGKWAASASTDERAREWARQRVAGGARTVCLHHRMCRCGASDLRISRCEQQVCREAAFMAAIFVLAALFWVTEALPLFATILLVIALQIVLLSNRCSSCCCCRRCFTSPHGSSEPTQWT